MIKEKYWIRKILSLIFFHTGLLSTYMHIYAGGWGEWKGGTICTLSKDFGLKNTMKHENRRPHPQIFSQLPSKKFDNNFAFNVVSSFWIVIKFTINRWRENPLQGLVHCSQKSISCENDKKTEEVQEDFSRNPFLHY